MEIKNCPHCDKKLEGYTKKQVEYMFMQHLLSKHPDKIIMRELGGKKTKSYAQLLKEEEERRKKK